MSKTLSIENGRVMQPTWSIVEPKDSDEDHNLAVLVDMINVLFRQEAKHRERIEELEKRLHIEKT